MLLSNTPSDTEIYELIHCQIGYEVADRHANYWLATCLHSSLHIDRLPGHSRIYAHISYICQLAGLTRLKANAGIGIRGTGMGEIAQELPRFIRGCFEDFTMKAVDMLQPIR